MPARMRVLVAFLLAGCYPSRPDPPEAPERPVPIDNINSRFDDFNAADMSPYWLHRLAFSSNRGSEGKQLDIYDTQLGWHGGKMHADSEPTVFLPSLMSDRDERGPLALGAYDSDTSWSTGWFVFASDRDGGAGGFDLYALPCSSWQPHRELPCSDYESGRPGYEAVPEPALVALALNSPRDDAYLSRAFADRRMLFASNRDAPDAASMKSMDIYAATWSDQATLADAPQSVTRVDALSSPADDSAPSVWRSYDRKSAAEMVFVSDRPGGQGEHDIYCSRYDEKAGTWSTPKNLGPRINSAKDEYRPILLELNTTRFLVFSSTRDGGQGGYDLYIVGYPGCR
jgi:hypothetical protein